MSKKEIIRKMKSNLYVEEKIKEFHDNVTWPQGEASSTSR